MTVKEHIMNSLTLFKSKLVGSIVNNCTSTSTSLPLSAAQGKSLQDQITTLNTNIDTWKSEKKSQWVVFSTNETITLPGVDTYLILTAHNSTSQLNGMWIYRPGNSTLWAIREASSISIDKNGYNIKVTSSAGTPSCMYCRLGSI